jgi:hypothetical protein
MRSRIPGSVRVHAMDISESGCVRRFRLTAYGAGYPDLVEREQLSLGEHALLTPRVAPDSDR